MTRAFQIVCGAAIVAALGSAGSAVMIDTVHVGNAGNIADIRYDASGYGAVAYEYDIGKYEVTAGQYADFLNAVATDDTHALYNSNMWGNQYGCKIDRSGSPGGYTYSVTPEWSNRPVNYVSWGDAARFANWLHNGQPGLDTPVPQDANSTEDGSYWLNGATTATALQTVLNRQDDATWTIPSEDEWYKAAYYTPDKDPNTPGQQPGYYDYPTSNDSAPSNDLVEPTDPGNNATFYDGAFTSPYYRTIVGGHENSDSPLGTFDQGGNVWEWNEAIIGSSRGKRGGKFGSYGADDLHASLRGEDAPTGEFYYTGFRVSEVATMGDTDGDHDVDITDYNNLVAQFGGLPGDDSADFDNDGFVDLEDFVVLRGNFGYGVSVSGGVPEAARTPEPATLTLLTLGGLALVRRRKCVQR